MKHKFSTKKTGIVLAFTLLVNLALLSNVVFASETDGTIDATDKYAWSENSGWINFGVTGGNVHVTDAGLIGLAWSENHGWINLSPAGSGVVNDGEGTLSGSAWGENLGWIDFTGVTIDDSGYFHGYANGTISGQISFNCDNTGTCGASDFKTRTDWRPQSVRSVTTIITDDVGRGGGGGVPPKRETGLLGMCKTTFVDIDEHWSKNYVIVLYCNGIVSGKDSEHYAPQDNATRAEVTKIALLMSGRSIDEDAVLEYPDVSENHWAYHIIATANEAGIVQGYPDGSFKPNQTITRAEALKIFLYAKGVDISDDKTANFPDVPEYSWFIDLVNYAFGLDIIIGYENGLFKPHQNISRGEIAKIAALIYGM